MVLIFQLALTKYKYIIRGVNNLADLTLNLMTISMFEVLEKIGTLLHDKEVIMTFSGSAKHNKH